MSLLHLRQLPLFVPPPAGGGSPPAAPTLSATSVRATTATFTTGAFSDPDAGDTHSATQIQVAAQADAAFASPVYDVTLGGVTVHTPPIGSLPQQTALRARARHRDAAGNWGGWTAVVPTFTTTARPVPAISSPTTGKRADAGVAVRFTGSASDADDGVLPGSALSWTSSLDGGLGTGTSIVAANLSVGEHTIELTATDSHGDQASVSITFIVGAAGGAGVRTRRRAATMRFNYRDPVAARRTVPVFLEDSAGNGVTGKGGQKMRLKKADGAWTPSAANLVEKDPIADPGHYDLVLDVAELDTPGYLGLRFNDAATVECLVDCQVEPMVAFGTTAIAAAGATRTTGSVAPGLNLLPGMTLQRPDTGDGAVIAAYNNGNGAYTLEAPGLQVAPPNATAFAVLASPQFPMLPAVGATGGVFLADAATLVSDIWAALAAALTAPGSIGEWIVQKLNVEVDTRSTLTAAGVWAHGTRTLTTLGALAGEVWTHGTRTLTALPAGILTAASMAADFAREIADRLLGRHIEGGADGGRTVGESLAVLRNRRELNAAGTVLTIYRADDSTPLFTMNVTTSAAQLPIAGLDPTS